MTQTSTSRVVLIHKYGGAEVLSFEHLPDLLPGFGEVAINVRAIGLNRSEVMFRDGRHTETAMFPARLGYEASGVIVQLGDGVNGLRAGDEVCIVPPPSITRWGMYAERVIVPADFVVLKPMHLTWIEAASVWMANMTAYGALIDIARMKAGDTAVILAASSSVGLACLQIAQAVGAKTIATTRTSSKKDALIAAGADHVITTRTESLVQRVHQLTSGKGVRIVFDPIAGAELAQSVEMMAEHGISIIYGALDLDISVLPILQLISKGLTVRGFTFKEIALDTDRRSRAVRFITEGLNARTLRPVIDKVFPFDQLREAHRYLESNAQFGKIVMELDPR